MPIDDWFYDTHIPNLSELVKQYVLTDYNIFDDGKIYTEKMQTVLTGLQCAVMERKMYKQGWTTSASCIYFQLQKCINCKSEYAKFALLDKSYL